MVTVILQISIHLDLKWEKKLVTKKEKIQSGREGRKLEKIYIKNGFLERGENMRKIVFTVTHLIRASVNVPHLSTEINITISYRCRNRSLKF